MARYLNELLGDNWTLQDRQFAAEAINLCGNGGHPVADAATLGDFSIEYLDECLVKACSEANMDGQRLAESLLVRVREWQGLMEEPVSDEGAQARFRKQHEGWKPAHD